MSDSKYNNNNSSTSNIKNNPTSTHSDLSSSSKINLGTSNDLHVPVMFNEILSSAVGIQKPILRILDCTFGRGGHSRALLEKFNEAKLTAIDKDQKAIEFGKINFENYLQQGRIEFINQDYSHLDYSNLGLFDFILLDLGVSSPQLDDAERGFSFYNDGPLDMRMNQTQEFSAETIINEYSEDELIKIFKDLGEIQKPFRVVRAVVHDRKTKRFTRTQELSSLIERVDGWRVKGHHPATKYFMALRLEVNRELDSVSQGIQKLTSHLTSGGRMSVITFHSLEDRIVKYIFKDLNMKGEGLLVNKKVIIPTDEEIQTNSRSRSAKLRVFEKK